jgi:hypothetical protein
MTATTDYHTFTTPKTPKSHRRKLDIGDIYSNAAKCLQCEEVVRSTNRHDFRSCSCGTLTVDGGSWYAKRIGDPAKWEDMSIMFDDAKEANED